jgi:hypothetical protein
MSIAFVTNRLGNMVTALGDARLARLAAIASTTVRRHQPAAAAAESIEQQPG